MEMRGHCMAYTEEQEASVCFKGRRALGREQLSLSDSDFQLLEL